MSRQTAKQLVTLSRLCVDAGRRSAQTPAGSSTGFYSRLQQPSVLQVRSAVLPAQEYSDDEPAPSTSAPPAPIKVDNFGGVSVISESDTHFQANHYYNVDGQRYEDGRYAAFAQEISAFVPKARQFTDPVRTFAYGTDASFYRLNPRMVVKITSEEEVARILPIAHKHQVPVTFRAAGTSLSGQALTDSVLLKLSHTGKNFRNFTIHVSRPSYLGSPAARAVCCCPVSLKYFLRLLLCCYHPVLPVVEAGCLASFEDCWCAFRRAMAVRSQWSQASLAERSTDTWQSTRRGATTQYSTKLVLTPHQ